MATDQQLDIRVHGQPQTQSPVHGGLLPPHGGVGGSGIGPVHGDGGAAFSPVSTTPHVWLDPSDLSTLFQAVGDGTPNVAVSNPVGKMLNKGSLGGDFRQATAGLRPLLQQDANGYYLDFDGVDDALASSTTLNFTTFGVLGFAIAFTPASTSTVRIITELSADINSNTGGFYLVQNSSVAGQLEMAVSAMGNVDNVRSADATFGSGVTSEISADMDIAQAAAAAKIPMRRNGAALSTTIGSDVAAAAVAWGNHAMYIGARGGTTNHAQTKFRGMLLKGGGFGVDIGSVDAWLMGKAGL